ncbi:MAG: hypothetical protein HC837_08225, partial [Chloroflexaceae bacterium]|nr:hypothetical protein [Chloroflexaceae bacterium]
MSVDRLILLVFVLLVALYHSSVPLGEGPDESGHFDYVLFLARNGQLPLQQAHPALSDVPGEGHQPPLAYLLMLPAVAWLPDDAAPLHLQSNPQFVWNDGTEPAATMRASREYWPWSGTVLAWHLARGVSTLLALLTLIALAGAAQTFAQQAGLPVRPIRLLAVTLVAFQPQFLFTAVLVTNDMLLTALSALLLWLCLCSPGRPRPQQVQ